MGTLGLHIPSQKGAAPMYHHVKKLMYTVRAFVQLARYQSALRKRRIEI